MTIFHLLDIPALPQHIRPEIEVCLDGKAKPPKSLGRLEELAVRIGLMQQCTQPKVSNPALILFAGDHGLTRSGVAADLTGRDGLIHRKVALGTNDASVEPAMSLQQAQLVLTQGAQVASEFIDKGADIIVLGEMGIGNSSSAALNIHRLTGVA